MAGRHPISELRVAEPGRYRALKKRNNVQDSTVDTRSQRTLIVEGTLVGPWVAELRTSWRNACQEPGGRKLVVDLCNLTVISHEGEEAIFALMKEGAEFSCGGVLMKHVLKQLAWKVRMPEAKPITSPASYASSGDFRRIFSEEMGELHELSFLLTGAVRKLSSALFPDWKIRCRGTAFSRSGHGHGPSRRSLCAVRVNNPRPTEEGVASSLDSSRNTPAVEQAEIAAILELRPFERFVYVMSVLERYSDQDCSVLLGCARAGRGGSSSSCVSATRNAIDFCFRR